MNSTINGDNPSSGGGSAAGSASTPGARPRAERPRGIWKILGPIWAVWTILMFVLTMLVFLVPFLLFCYFRPDPQKTKWFCRYSGVWMGVFLPLAGCPLRIRGKEKFAKGETYI